MLFAVLVVGCSSNSNPSTGTTPGNVKTAGTGAAGQDKGGSSTATTAGTGTGGSTTPSAGSGATAGAAASSGSGTAGQSGTGSTAGASGTTAGAGATSGSGGTSGNAGSSGTGGASGMEDEDAGMVCMPLSRPLNTTIYPKCSKDICPAQDSVCIQTSLLSSLKIPQSTIDLLADCDAMTKCVPEALASQAGHAILPKCTSLIGAEGRCTSVCVPEVAQQASQLPKDVCTGTDLCAPCYDPRTGKSTGACSQGCDPGPTQPPKMFAKCCSSRGLCVPPATAGAQAPNLNQDTCDSGLLCAPAELTDPTFKPKTCSSLDDAEGRCVSTCVGGAVAAQKDHLPTAGCGADEVCAPCYDPITGMDTGACEINGDKPTKPPYTFPRCCDNGQGTKTGVCVTPALAGSEASMLRQDTCASGRLCAPEKKAADPKYKFPMCTGLGQGACVPSCILDPTEAGILSRVNCAVGEVCAPCDVLGQSTGACD